MAKLNEIKVMVTGYDKVTGNESWESTLADLKSWHLSQYETSQIINGETVKCISPNGKRTIWITKK